MKLRGSAIKDLYVPILHVLEQCFTITPDAFRNDLQRMAVQQLDDLLHGRIKGQRTINGYSEATGSRCIVNIGFETGKQVHHRLVIDHDAFG